MKHTIQVSFRVDSTQPKEPDCYGAPCAEDKGVINALEVA